MTYEFKHSNGSNLGTVNLLENNGPDNKSIAREIIDVVFGDTNFSPAVDSFVVAGDATHLVKGQLFVVETSGYAGTYTLSDGVGSSPSGAQIAVLVNGNTHIPVAAGIALPDFSIVAVVTGSAGKFGILNAQHGKHSFLPGLTFTVNDNSFSGANTTYTVASAETSETTVVQSVVSELNTITLVGDGARFFSVDTTFQLSGTSNSIGAQVYTVSSVSVVNGNTVIVTNEVIPNGTIATAQTRATRTNVITFVTITGSIPSGTQADGSARLQTAISRSFVAPTTVNATATQRTFDVVYNIPGNYAATLIQGTPVLIKGANIDGTVRNYVARVASATFFAPSGAYPEGRTQVATVYLNNVPTTPVIILGASARFVFPIPALPFGYMSYSTHTTLSPFKLVGKGATQFNDVTAWGQALQENTIHAAEHFMSVTPPVGLLTGSLWYDTAAPALRFKSKSTFNITDVLIGSGGTQRWSVDADQNSVGSVGDKIVVFDNAMYETSTEFTIASISSVTTPSSSSGYTTHLVVTEAIVPGSAAAGPNTSAPYGRLYNKTQMQGVVIPGLPVTNNINMGGYKITNSSIPTVASDLVTKQYVDDRVNGIIWISPILDPNLFADNLSSPPTIPADDRFISYHRTYIVNGTGTGEWTGFNGHAMYYDAAAAQWKSVLGRPVAVGDRFGVFIEPDDDDNLSTPTSGGLSNQAGKIATITGVSPYTYTFYTPAEPDAVTVKGNISSSSPHMGHSYTFRGTWGAGTYGTNFRWIEFSGPQMLIDGAGLEYTANILNVVVGTGITVGSGNVAIDTTYMNANYMRRDGTVDMDGNLDVGMNRIINVGDATAGTDGVSRQFGDGRYVQVGSSGNSIDISGTNLNVLTKVGFYRGSAVINAPDGGWFYFTHEQHTPSGYIKQVATAFENGGGGGNVVDGGITYVRVCENSVWKPWKRVVFDTELTTTVVAQSADYTFVVTDANKYFIHPTTDTIARTWTVPANASVAFPIGTTLTIDNDSGAGDLTIAINTDTLVLVGAAGSTGTRTLASGGQATLTKVSATRWRITGVALT